MGWKVPYVSSFGNDFNFDFGVSFTEEQRRHGAEYNFERVEFEDVLERFAGSDSMAEAAASCGTDLVGYVTTEGPGLSAFALSDGVDYHTYSCYAPESDFSVFYNQLLDRAPKGRSDTSRCAATTSTEDAGAGVNGRAVPFARHANIRSCQARGRSCTPTSTRSLRRSSNEMIPVCAAAP